MKTENITLSYFEAQVTKDALQKLNTLFPSGVKSLEDMINKIGNIPHKALTNYTFTLDDYLDATLALNNYWQKSKTGLLNDNSEDMQLAKKTIFRLLDLYTAAYSNLASSQQLGNVFRQQYFYNNVEQVMQEKR